MVRQFHVNILYTHTLYKIHPLEGSDRVLRVTAMENSGRTTVRKTVWSMAITAVTVMMILECAAAEQLHKVGSRGWIPDYNYIDWLNQRHELFYVGDWLLFVFDKHSYNVLEVNETNYESCNDQGFIKNITRGGRDVVQLTEARPYYFLSSGGYCWGGMKVAINVENLAPAPAPASTKNVSPSNILSRQMIVLIAFCAVMAWLVLFL